ncbi:MAG: ATPase [Lachnospiraceae bacterium]|nr:ATPase [Lachnospiraceae bacterium]
MASKIEDIIEQIEDYIDTCKPAAFSGSKIVVNRDELDAYLDDLKTTTPEEIKRYQKIISNKEAILADAKNKADAIIAEAQIQTSELVSEHQIMQQAYAQANEVVMIATKNAQEMLDKATEDANNIRLGAMEYTDNLLKSIEEVLVASIDTTKARTDKYLNTMQGFLDVVVANREELRPQEEVKSEPAAPVAEEKPAAPEEPKKEEGPSIAISEEFFNKD